MASLRGGLNSEMRLPGICLGALGWLPTLLESRRLVRCCSQRLVSPGLRSALFKGSMLLLSPPTTQHRLGLLLPGLLALSPAALLLSAQTLREPGLPVHTCAVGLAGVQPVAGAADASVAIWEVHTGSGATDVGGSSGTSVNICGRQSKADVTGHRGGAKAVEQSGQSVWSGYFGLKGPTETSSHPALGSPTSTWPV